MTEWEPATTWGLVPASSSRSRVDLSQDIGWLTARGVPVSLFTAEVGLGATPCGRNLAPGVRITLAGGDPDDVFTWR